MKKILSQPLIYTLGVSILIWVIFTEFFHIKKIFLPSVTDTIFALIELGQTKNFWYDILFSFLRVVFGFSLYIYN